MVREGKIRMMLTSGQSLRRLGLASELQGSPRLSIVTECGSGRDVLDALEFHWREQEPDVLLVDGNLPDMTLSGLLHAIRAMRCDEQRGAGFGCLRILIILEEETPEDVMALLASGTHGLCSNHVSPQALVEAVHHIHEGGLWFDADAAAYVQEALSAPLAFIGDKRPVCPGLVLTAREREVLGLMIEGMNNRQIAAQLSLSVHTIKAEVSHILRKMSATDRVEAVVKAIRGDLLSESPSRPA